jgi:hypothetical protein
MSGDDILRSSTPQNTKVRVSSAGLRCPFEGNCVSGFVSRIKMRGLPNSFSS